MQTRFAVGSKPQSVVVTDVDGDSILDLVTANADYDDVSVLQGIGDGIFKVQKRLAVESRPKSVIVADINGDSVPDLITANFDSVDVSMLRGQGDGTFAAQKRLIVGSQHSSPHSVAVADINGDSISDLVSADSEGDFSVLLGQGEGAFEAPVSHNFGVPFHQRGSISVTDINEDNVPDLIISGDDFSGYATTDVSVLLGRGEGTFSKPMRVTAGFYLKSAVVSDVNGDKIPDLITANASGLNIESGEPFTFHKISNDISVLLGQGDGTFDPSAHFVAGVEPASAAVADVNGLPDLVTAIQ